VDSHVFGPVPSRRLGRSLGVDLVPFKTCSLDCLYCQLGRTTHQTLRRAEYVPVEEVLAELQTKLAQAAPPDFITLSGSGEPTLHSRLGDVIRGVKAMTDVPVAVLTNGVHFHQADVRQACAQADVVAPSLDAPSPELFATINRPDPGVTFQDLIDGLVAFRGEMTGGIWLEVFLLQGLNTAPEHLDAFRRLIGQIRPDKVQLNTAVRPTAEAKALRVPEAEMHRLATLLGPEGEVIADFRQGHEEAAFAAKREDVRAMLARRPCSRDDIAAGLAIHRNEAIKYIEELIAQGAIEPTVRGGVTYYRAKG